MITNDDGIKPSRSFSNSRARCKPKIEGQLHQRIYAADYGRLDLYTRVWRRGSFPFEETFGEMLDRFTEDQRDYG